MKVRMVVTVDVDPSLWTEEYGCKRDEVREDVRRYFTYQIEQAYVMEGASLTVRVA